MSIQDIIDDVLTRLPIPIGNDHQKIFLVDFVMLGFSFMLRKALDSQELKIGEKVIDKDSSASELAELLYFHFKNELELNKR